MLGLLESKLNSLPPEISNGYPELIYISLNDVNPEIVKVNPTIINDTNANNSSTRGNNSSRNAVNTENTANSGVESTSAEAPKEEIREVVSKEPTAKEKLDKFIEENEDITTYYNMLK